MHRFDQCYCVINSNNLKNKRHTLEENEKAEKLAKSTVEKISKI